MNTVSRIASSSFFYIFFVCIVIYPHNWNQQDALFTVTLFQ